MINQSTFFKFLKGSLSVFVLMTFSCFADVSVKLSKNKAGLNESFSLIFSSTDPVQSAPDFTPLNQDFDIVSTSQSQNFHLINGAISQETQWNLVLIAKKEGKLTIPAISINQQASAPLEIEIVGMQEVKSDDSLFIETEIIPASSVYERSQILYIMRFYRSVNLGQATLTEPVVNDSNALIEKVGKDNEYEYYHANGNRYVVFERMYAVFPQQIGNLTFSPVVFSGQVVKGHSFFNMQAEHRRIESSAQEIEVKPIPAPFNKDNWLAAYDLKLTEEWSSDPRNMVVGEPITWTVTITADGCLGSLIPEVDLVFPDTVKQYRDKAETSNQESQLGILGTKQLKIALIANQMGQIQLPEITVQWWNLKTNQVETAHLPAKVLTIENDPLAARAVVDNDELQFNKQESDRANPTPIEVIPWWAWCIMSLNLFWIALIAGILYKRRPLKIKIKKNVPFSFDGVRKQLKQACQDNDAKHVEALLVSWASFQYPQKNIGNLSQLKNLTAQPLKNQIDTLYNYLYGFEKSWSGMSLWECLKDYKESRVKQKI